MVALLAARTADECAGFLPSASFASWRSGLGLTYARASLVLALGAPGAIAGNLSAVLGDHRSRRVIAATGAFGYAVSLLAFAAGQGFAALACASFTTGFFAHTLVNGTELALIDVAGPRVTAFLARGMLFGTAGGLLGPVLLLLTAGAGVGWRGAFAAAGLLMAVYGVWLASLPMPRPARRSSASHVRHGVRTVARDARVWYFGVVALLAGALQQPFVAFVVAFATQAQNASGTVTTVLAGSWIIGVIVAATRASRSRPGSRARRMTAGAAAVLAGTLCATAVPLTAALAAGIAACAYGESMLTLAIKSRIVERHPGRVGSAFALVSTLEFAGFSIPIAVGRIADTHGVHAGLSCFTALAFVLLVVAALGDRMTAGRGQASSARAI